ncbi:putative toxin-antitoxin system toxin component, PIN family [Thermodesulfobacteriota bacterium]
MGQTKVIPVVVDTNVIVSALLFAGTPGRLIDLWKEKRIQLFVCKEMIDEIMRVLAYPRFQLTEKEIDYLLYVEILPYSEIVDIPSGPVIISRDPSDDKFIRCAKVAEADVIVSGDRHLLSLKEHEGIKILTPAQFLSNLQP